MLIINIEKLGSRLELDHFQAFLSVFQQTEIQGVEGGTVVFF